MHVIALDYTAVAVSGKVDPVKPVNHTSLITVVTSPDRPKSVCDRCVIELLVTSLCCHVAFLYFWWYRGLCHRTGSDLVCSYNNYHIVLDYEWISTSFLCFRAEATILSVFKLIKKKF